MPRDELLRRIRDRVHGADIGTSGCATAAEIVAAEKQLGFTLHRFHQALLLEVANGGFGPGIGGVFGVGEPTDAEKQDVVTVWRELQGREAQPGLPEASVPLCDFGCGTWVLVDAASGNIQFTCEDGVFELSCGIRDWFEKWLNNADLHETMFDSSRAPVRHGINPFTRLPMELRGSGPPRGTKILTYSF